MDRKDFIKSIGLLSFAGAAMNLNDLKGIAGNLGKTQTMPVLFIGHGNPMNALYDNPFTKTLTGLGKDLKKLEPKAILVVSAHWLTGGTYVHISQKPKTIHDFGGFPDELFQMQYPANGSPEFALETKKLITSVNVLPDTEWGLDHGAWTILKHIFPLADIPVFELSIDYDKSPEYHYNLATQLKELRNEGVLIIGSGNIVHNLGRINFSQTAKPFDWASEFDEIVKVKLNNQDYKSLIDYNHFGNSAKLSIPTNDHYLPMLYTLGASNKNENLKFIYEEIQNSSISMRCFQIG